MFEACVNSAGKALSIYGHYLKGLAKGAVSTIDGMINMVAHPIETAKGLGQLAGVAVIGYSSPPGMPPPTIEQAEKRLKAFDSVFNTHLSEVDQAIKESVVETVDIAVNGTAEERAELAGETAFAIVDIVVGTKGVTKISKAAKAGKLGKVGKLMSKFARYGNKLVNKTASILSKAGKKTKTWILEKGKKAIKGIFKRRPFRGKGLARKTAYEKAIEIVNSRSRKKTPKSCFGNH